MSTKLALTVPGYGPIEAPKEVPTGGLRNDGADIIQTGVTLLIVTAIVVALFMLTYSGIQWIMSRGDKQMLDAARMRIIYTIIGLVVVFLSFMIVNIIGGLFGVQLLSL